MTSKAPAMAPSTMPISEVLDRIHGPRRAEAEELLTLFKELTSLPPVIWAGRIIGFGEYEYTYDSGHSGLAPLMAFASNSTKHTIYLQRGFADRWPQLLSALGPHKASVACLYLSRTATVDRTVLSRLLEASYTLALADAGLTTEEK